MRPQISLQTKVGDDESNETHTDDKMGNQGTMENNSSKSAFTVFTNQIFIRASV